jgi:hypothetical protein
MTEKRLLTTPSYSEFTALDDRAVGTVEHRMELLY